MKNSMTLAVRFVESIPKDLATRALYVSMDYATVVHKCCCGCGREVVTPLSPTDWKLIFDGETITLNPSIGNWSFECRSHYWIVKNAVRWADACSNEEIYVGRAHDRVTKKRYYAEESQIGLGVKMPPGDTRRNLWWWVSRLWSR